MTCAMNVLGGRRSVVRLTAAGIALGLGGALWLRSRFVGDPPPLGGPHAVATDELTVPGPRAALALHVWRPAKLEPSVRAPLLLFAPGWGGRATQSSLLCAELASRGYVVVAFDDVKWDPSADAQEVADSSAALDISSEAAFRNSMRAARVRVRLEVEKARHVLDELSTLSRRRADFWANVDTEQVGMLGFSFGGSVAPEVALDDPRFRASANLDGGLFGDVPSRGFPHAYLLLSTSEAFPPESDLRAREDWRRLAAEWNKSDNRVHAQALGQAGFHWFAVDRSYHEDFLDKTFTPVWRDALRRSWSARTTERLGVNALLAAFFDTYLRGRPSELMQAGVAPAGTRRITSWP